MNTVLKRTTRCAALLGTVAALTLTGCAQQAPGTGTGASGTADAAGTFPQGQLTLVAPAAPGGGWDGTARALAQAAGDLAPNAQVVNIAGAGGTIGLAQFAGSPDPDSLMVMGATMVGAIETNDSAVSLADVVPVARLTGEYHVLVVPAASPYKTLADFTAAFTAEPGALPIAGGSAGGTDQITAGLYAEAVGADPAAVNYVPYSGGGEALAALLGNQVAGGISNVNEWEGSIQSGDLRVLAVTAPERLEGLDAPTFTEQGVDVTFANWRAVVAPPETTPEQVEAMGAFLQEVHDTSAWKEAVATNGWEDQFATGPEVQEFFDAQQEEILGTLEQIGLVQ